MNVFRLVNGGTVDKIIAFDTLPKRLTNGLRTKPMDGFPRFWHRWLIENKSTQTVSLVNKETGIKADHEQPCTYLLEYKVVNADIEKWQEITNYVRKAVDLSVRLMDKIEDMAKPFAKDSTSELALEPEEVPIIPIPSEVKVVVETARSKEAVMAEDVAVPVKKNKGGRPRKIKEPVGV
jgi:hypothetical protein